MKTAITSLMALMVSLTITLAGTNGNGFGNGGTPAPSNGGVKGLGAQITHYTASYTDPFFGPVTCTGVHQSGKNFGLWGQDSFTCTQLTVTFEEPSIVRQWSLSPAWPLLLLDCAPLR